MNLECSKDKLQRAIVLAEKISAKNASLPVLASVLLKAEKQSLFIKATNLELGLELELPAKINNPGQVAVNANILSNFLVNLPINDNKIVLSIENGNLNINSSNSQTTIKSLITDDFPTIPIVSADSSYFINAQKMTEGLKAVMFAASLSDIKPEIASIYIFQENQELYFVATDSFRLAEKRIVLSANQGNLSPMIIPIKNIPEIIRIFESLDVDVIIRNDKNQVAFSADNIYFVSRLIDGVYPDYRQIMPKEQQTEAIVDREDLLNYLKLSNIFSDKFNQIEFSFETKDSLIRLKTNNQETGQSEVKISANISGETLTVSFNGKYIIDCFQSIKTESIIFNLNEKNKPLLINGLGDNSFNYLVMPVNR